jgi:guanylate kinase
MRGCSLSCKSEDTSSLRRTIVFSIHVCICCYQDRRSYPSQGVGSTLYNVCVLILLTGPSGCGKTCAITAGQASGKWYVVPTLTTRPARDAGHDSKVNVMVEEARILLAHSQDYIVTEYDGHVYFNRKQDLRLAASAKPPSLGVVDWVHRYPTPLEAFGPYALGIVLCPSLDELRRRLTKADRLGRLPSCNNDYWRIRREKPTYPVGWTVLGSNEPSTVLVERITELAQTDVSNDLS